MVWNLGKSLVIFFKSKIKRCLEFKNLFYQGLKFNKKLSKFLFSVNLRIKVKDYFGFKFKKKLKKSSLFMGKKLTKGLNFF